LDRKGRKATTDHKDQQGHKVKQEQRATLEAKGHKGSKVSRGQRVQGRHGEA
jgi:hypothetical protein